MWYSIIHYFNKLIIGKRREPQSVLRIDHVRLLQEALEEQKGAAEIFKILSSSDAGIDRNTLLTQAKAKVDRAESLKECADIIERLENA